MTTNELVKEKSRETIDQLKLDLEKSQSEIKELKEKFMSVADQSLMGMAIIQDGKLKYVNSAMSKINGFSYNEMLDWEPNEFFKFIHPDDAPSIIKYFKEIQEEICKTVSFRCRLFTKTGNLKYVDVFLKLFNYQEKPAINLSLIDNTDIVLTGQKLKESEKKSRENSFLANLFMENMSCVVLLLRPGTREVVISNQKGIDAGALPGKNCYNTWGQRQDPCPWCLAPKVWKTRQPQHLIVDAVDIIWDAYWIPIRDDLYLHYAFDITEQKKREQKLEELNKTKTDLLNRISHELRTPLVSIKGFVDLLLSRQPSELKESTIEIVKEIKDGSIRLENLITDILKTSELKSGKMQLNKTTENLSDLIRVCVKEFKGLSRLRNQNINLNIQDNMITMIDKKEIYNVISNLIMNAIQYTPVNGEIKIQSKIKQGYYYISIRDNGIGFTREEEHKLFTEFGKIERFGRGYDVMIEGSGLGLFIAKEIIDLHDGQIWMKSEGRNQGSDFIFTIPIQKD